MKLRPALVALCVGAGIAGTAAAAEVDLHRLATGDIGVLIRVDATLDGRTLHWLIDSGSTHNLIAPGVAAAPADGAERVPLRSAAGTLSGAPVTLGELRIGDLSIAGQTALRVDLTPVLGPLAAQVDGVLGMPFLDHRRVRVDLQRQRIDFDAGDGPESRGAATIARVRGLPVIDVVVQGRALPLLLDTGTAGGIIRLRRALRPTGVWLAPQVEIAGLPRGNVPVADLAGTALGRSLPAGVAGTLGLATLDGCRFTLDLVRDRFGVDTCARDSLPGGFGLQWSSSNGRLVLVQVWPGSPAQRAGLKAGDRVLTLDGAPASADTTAADAVLAGRERIELVVEREGGNLAATLARAYFLPPLPPAP